MKKFTVVIDSNEYEVGNTWTFPGRKIEVRSLLKYGCDYTVRGFTGLIGVERKSHGDFVRCCGKAWPRFQRQLEKLDRNEYRCVIVAGNLADQIYRGSRMTLGAVAHKVAIITAMGIPVLFAHDEVRARNMALEFFNESIKRIRNG